MKRSGESNPKKRGMTHTKTAGHDTACNGVLPAAVVHMVRHAAAPAVVLGADGTVLLWNERMATVTGVQAAQRLQRPLQDGLIAPYDTNHKQSVHDEARKAPDPTHWLREDRLKFKTAADGRVADMVMSFTAFVSCGRKSAVVAIVGIGRDQTYEKFVVEQRHRILDAANAPCIAVDTHGCVTVLNRKAQEISEYASADVIGIEMATHLVADNSREHVSSVIQRALQGQETASYEFTMLTKTGRRVELLMNALPRYDTLGNVVGVIGIGQDITESVVLEKEYNRLIDTAKGPIFALDKEYQIILWNKEAAEITEYAVDDAMGEDLLTFTTHKFRGRVHGALTKAMDGEEVGNFEFPLITKSGRRLDILLNASPRFDEAGQIVGVIGIGQDITDRRAQEQEYSRLIDTANAPIFGVDTDGRVNTWNKKAAQITEYSLIDVLGSKLVEEFIPLDFQRKVSNVLSKAAQGVETANFEFPLITRSGRRVEILLNATPRYDEKGEIIGVVGIGQDITVRIAQEQEYTRLIDTANAPIFGVDMGGLVNIWNKKAAEITQYAPEDVMGKDLVQHFISEEYRFAVGLVFSQALNGVLAANFNLPLITRAGRRVEILLNATPRYNELGDIVGVVGIGQDITERIAQEQEYSRLIDTANAPIFGVDESGSVNIWNKKAAEITQFAPSEVMGENLVEKFIREDYRDAVGCVLTKALDGIETANFEFPLMTKAGRRVEILLNATPRFNEHGKVMGMVGIGQDITDRIAQEQEYARLIEKANAPIFGVDVDGCVNIWNRKTADITQYTRDEVIGEKLVDRLISEDYRDAVANVLARALNGDEYSNFEVPLLTKTGRKVMILLNATARFDQHGEIVGMVGIGQDLTDRIAQQEEYARLIDTANAPIFGVDRNLCVNIWNKKAAQITQYTTTEVMGENLVETFISPEYRPVVAEVLTKALKGEQTANFEFPLITRPGTRIEILLNATPRMDFHGNIVGVVGIGQDITDRIAQEHEYFRLIDTANAPIFGVDTYGCVNEWNQKIEEITGHHKIAVLGLSLVDAFITLESRPLVRKLLNQALIGIDVGEMELPMTTKDNRSILLLVNASSKKDMHGNIRGVIGVGQDYTAKKHMEAAKVTFLASFSHELRTPLNGVLGMLEMLREQKLEKVPQRYVHMAYVSGSLLLNLINDILDLSKIEAGHLEISKDPFLMQDLLDYVVEIFKFKAKEKGIKLVLKCSENVPSLVVGDVSRLRQVLLNLLSNAIKFTNDGSITVQCRIVPSPDLQRQSVKLLFQVIDTGVGMDSEEKGRLFSLFTKLDRTRKNNPTGSGLGLAICKQLVELMGGEIDVESSLTDGSEFFFTVIVDRVDCDGTVELQNFPSTVSTDSELDNVPKYARILVVEDNEFNWEVVKCYFTKDNHYLQWEQNGRDAFYAYREHPDLYDMVLMDCEMPIMDGYTATRSIRLFELENSLPRIPILGLTAYAMSGDRKKCLDAGMDEFIVKPIGKAALLAAVRQWLAIRYMSLKASNKEPSVFSDDGESITESNTVNLVPASKHNEELDLHRAISDLELEDPMMIGREGHRSALVQDSLLTMSALSQSKSGNSLAEVIGMTLGEQSDCESVGGRTLERLKLAVDDSPMRTIAEIIPIEGGGNVTQLSGSFSLGERSSSSTSRLSQSKARRDSASDVTATSNSRVEEVPKTVPALVPPPIGPPSFTSSVLPEEIPIPEGDPIDYALGVEQCGGDETLFFSLLEKYGSVCEEYMRRIEVAYSVGDYVVLRRESHSLKGSSAYVAAMRVSKSAFRVQVASERVMATMMPHYDEVAYAASLKNSLDLLKRENRLVLGYLRRNFSFRKNSGHVNPETRRNDDQNVCAIM